MDQHQHQPQQPHVANDGLASSSATETVGAGSAPPMYGAADFGFVSFSFGGSYPSLLQSTSANPAWSHQLGDFNFNEPEFTFRPIQPYPMAISSTAMGVTGEPGLSVGGGGGAGGAGGASGLVGSVSPVSAQMDSLPATPGGFLSSPSTTNTSFTFTSLATPNSPNVSLNHTKDPSGTSSIGSVSSSDSAFGINAQFPPTPSPSVHAFSDGGLAMNRFGPALAAQRQPQTAIPTRQGSQIANGSSVVASTAKKPSKRNGSAKSSGGDAEGSDVDEEMSDDSDAAAAPVLTRTYGDSAFAKRKGEIRKARIEAEQRRRNELREGFQRLKHSLGPDAASARLSKSGLISKAICHIKTIERDNDQLRRKCQMLNDENKELKITNEALIRSSGQPLADASNLENRRKFLQQRAS